MITAVTLLSAAVFACSPVVGTVDTTSERVDTAFRIFVTGIFLLVAHAAVFIYRTIKKKRKNKWVFWVTLVLSLLIIPIVFFLILLSAGMSCGFGAIERAMFLLTFEFICLVIQMVSWRFSNQPVISPIPPD